jgi:hypothetical protein
MLGFVVASNSNSICQKIKQQMTENCREMQSTIYIISLFRSCLLFAIHWQIKRIFEINNQYLNTRLIEQFGIDCTTCLSAVFFFSFSDDSIRKTAKQFPSEKFHFERAAKKRKIGITNFMIDCVIFLLQFCRRKVYKEGCNHIDPIRRAEEKEGDVERRLWRIIL